MAPSARRTSLRTSASPAEQEHEIVSAAEAEFTSVGVRRASLDEIARAARVSRSTLYRRFPGKEDLLVAVVQRMSLQLSHDLGDATRGLGPRDAVVEAFVLATREVRGSTLAKRLLVDEPEMLELVVGGPTSRDGVSLIDTVGTLIAGTLRRAGATMPDADLRIAADLVFRVLVSVSRAPSEAVSIDDESAVRAMATTFLAPMVH
ncbi:TetR/AcrR family transcriptional regulator [Williamsia deligens]|uniref:TetR/AcrR family transcriptional regulator n=1 Tax=Williamsia deligens TaxID=321325 RepID=A0ABW3G4I9_9NOCA|nr:TetR/AcrR family transcriptional regulator [Williamsia deligens]MCP2193711.1 transcriptional regulator, TetR family [Williamsia deligens]